MQELEKILEEMQEVKEIMLSPQNIDCFGEPCKENDCCACVINKCMEIVKKHMNDGWIPVGERLPEDDEMMLVTCETKSGRRSVNRAWYGNGFWHGSGSMSGVIAWQPLPETYHPERSDSYDGE